MTGGLDIDRLRGAVHGTVLSVSDPGYDDARRVFNATVDAHPALIVQVAGTDDVAHVQAFARERDLSLSVRGTGLGSIGDAMCGDVVIDMSAVRGIVVDRTRRCSLVRAGTTWGEFDAATQAHGLAVPGARLSRAGVVGHTLRDGVGWLTARCGRTRENVVSADAVTPGGKVVSISARAPDALRTFPAGTVVTSLTFQLHDVSPRVLGGVLLFGLCEAPEVLTTLAELHADGTPAFTPAAAFTSAPPARFVPGDVVGRPVLAVLPAWLGDPDDGTRQVQLLRKVARPLADCVRPMTYPALQSSLDDMLSPGMRLSSASGTLPPWNPDLAAELTDAATTAPGKLAHIALLPEDGTSWVIHVIAQWRVAEHDARHSSWPTDVLTRIETTCGAHR